MFLNCSLLIIINIKLASLIITTHKDKYFTSTKYSTGMKMWSELWGERFRVGERYRHRQHMIIN